MTIDIETINSQINLPSLAEKYGSKLHHSGAEWRGNCPLHGGKNKNGFSIYDHERRWTCFSGDCGGGDALGFIMKYHKCSLPDAVNIALGGRSISPEEMDNIRIQQAERVARELEIKIQEAQEALKSLKDSHIWMKYHSNLQENISARDLWRANGIPDTWQDFWQLGYDPNRTIWSDNTSYISPTMTIPIFDLGWNILNVRHRIMNPIEPWDKYRPERAGLPPNVFICDPDLKSPKGAMIIEGEKKAMVAYLTLDDLEIQGFGLAGKNTPIDLILEKIIDIEPIYLIFDPDASIQATKTADKIGKERSRIVDLPMKIDDLIIKTGLEKDLFQKILNQSRRP